MFDDELLELCRKLKPVIGPKADALWLAYVTSETPEAKFEAQSFIQMFGIRHLAKKVDDTSILLPPPSFVDALGEFKLGTVYYGRQMLYGLSLRRDNFLRHIGIFGITGSGKTVVAQNLLLGLLEKDIPFLVIDWKRSYRALLTLPNPKVKKIQVFTVGRKSARPFNWNPLRGPPSVHPRTWISVLVEVLEKSHISGPGVADILIEILDKRFDDLGFFSTGQVNKKILGEVQALAGGAGEELKSDERAYPNFFDAALELSRVRYRGRKMLWADSASRIIRTFSYGPAAGAFNARNPIKLEELLEQPVILELDQELPGPLRVFLSEIVFRWIHLYRLGQGETDELRHVIFLEELHNLFSKSSLREQVTNSLELGFREIRGFGEGLVGIDQHPSLLPISVLGNTNTQIYLGLQHEEDIITAKRALFLPMKDEILLDRLGVGEGIIKIKGRINPCYVKFPFVPVKKGMIDDSLLSQADSPDGDKEKN